jgi:hypothetical protein
MEKVEVFRVFHKRTAEHYKGGSEKVYDCVVNISVEEAKKTVPFLSEKGREIIDVRKEVITINNNPFCKEKFVDGLLISEWIDENPNYEDDMRITQMDIAEMEENDAMIDFFDSINSEDI